MQRDVGNMLSGSVLTAVGIFYCLYAYTEYPTGSIRQIGPGLFPVALGVILAGLGLLIFVTALFSTGRTPALSVATPLLVLLAVAAFALLIRPFGLIPAVIATTIISSLAELRFRLLSTALLCVALAAFSWLVFGLGLGLSVPMLRLPGWF